LPGERAKRTARRVFEAWSGQAYACVRRSGSGYVRAVGGEAKWTPSKFTLRQGTWSQGDGVNIVTRVLIGPARPSSRLGRAEGRSTRLPRQGGVHGAAVRVTCVLSATME
jgi:hypothetical protein